MANRVSVCHLWKNVDKTLNEIRRLQNERKYRNVRQAFFIEGIRNFVQVVDQQFDIEVIVYSQKLLTSPLARKFVRQKRRSGVPALSLTPEQFRSFSTTSRASGVGAIVKSRWSTLEAPTHVNGLCWVVLGHVRSGGNLGTLIRTSEAIGGAGFILLDKRVNPYDPGVVRASMGGVFRQHFIRSTREKLSSWLKGNDGQLVGASPDGDESFQQFQFPKSTFLFLGEERQGLTDQERLLCDHLLKIPMVGHADSLNLGVAGSLMLYEIFRNQSVSDVLSSK